MGVIGGIGGVFVGRGGVWLVVDFFCCLKKDEGFFCNVGWWECDDEVFCEGGVELFEVLLLLDLIDWLGGEVMWVWVCVFLFLELLLKICWKNFCFFLGVGVLVVCVLFWIVFLDFL